MTNPRNILSKNLEKGNFSDKYKSSIISYYDKLNSQNLPVIYSRKHLALIFKMDYKALSSYLHDERNCHYHFYEISKRNGGKRQISVPHYTLRQMQDWIKYNILDKVESDQSAYAYKKGKSIKDNASLHLNAEQILKIDFIKFFESISEYRVFHLFKHLGYHTNLAVDLAKLCTCPLSARYYETFTEDEKIQFQNTYNNKVGVLPQGAPTSPSLSNLICLRLDRRLRSLSKANSINYSRYSDDITFSGKRKQLPSLKLIKKIINEEGFYINPSKTKRISRGQRQIVTGLLTNGEVRIPQSYKKNIFRHLYFCIKHTPRQHFQYLTKQTGIEKGFQKQWLLGQIIYVHSIEPKVGARMFGQFKKIEWDY